MKKIGYDDPGYVVTASDIIVEDDGSDGESDATLDSVELAKTMIHSISDHLVNTKLWQMMGKGMINLDQPEDDILEDMVDAATDMIVPVSQQEASSEDVAQMLSAGFISVGPDTIHVLDFEEILPVHAHEMQTELVHEIMMKSLALIKQFKSMGQPNVVPLFKKK